MPQNIVDILARYPVRNRFDPRENRLTAAVVAALDQAHSLRAALIEDLWKASDRPDQSPGTSGPSSVTAQHPVVHAGHAAWFVDMELLAADGATCVWIEAKVASGLSGPNQLDKYASALRGHRARHKLLVILAPAARRADMERHLPQRAGVATAFASWTQAHRVLSAWKPATGSEQQRRWLVKEVAAYMAREGHESVARITKTHDTALRHHDAAVEGVQHLFDVVASELARTWKPKANGASRRRRWEGWLQQEYLPYRATADNKASERYQTFGFAFELLPTPVFGAGVYFRAGLPVHRRAAIEHHAQTAGGDSRCDVEAAEPYLWRDLPLRNLLTARSIEEQADLLAAFAGATFETLDRRAPDATDPA